MTSKPCAMIFIRHSCATAIIYSIFTRIWANISKLPMIGLPRRSASKNHNFAARSNESKFTKANFKFKTKPGVQHLEYAWRKIDDADLWWSGRGRQAGVSSQGGLLCRAKREHPPTPYTLKCVNERGWSEREVCQNCSMWKNVVCAYPNAERALYKQIYIDRYR